MQVGIEVGGTFTDLVAVDRDRVIVAKVPSMFHAPDIGAYAALGAGGTYADQALDLVHGSTAATNAILERRAGRIAFVTTLGFHDMRNIDNLRYAQPKARRKGDIVTLSVGGGGGYGPRSGRNGAARALDLLKGYVTA